jgi:hypothetical protein
VERDSLQLNLVMVEETTGPTAANAIAKKRLHIAGVALKPPVNTGKAKDQNGSVQRLN